MTEGSQLKSTTYQPPRILFNMDGDDLIRQVEWPATPEPLLQTVFEEYAGTHIDTMIWSPGDGMFLFHHPNREGSIYGAHLETVTPNWWIALDNGRRLREHGGELKILGGAAKRYGFKFYVSHRMNDQHDRLSDGFRVPIKQQHPEWLIGKADPSNKDLNDWAAMTAINHAVPEARAFRLRVIRELVGDHEMDGFQLDFMSCPPFFRKDEQRQNIPVMTEFVCAVRAILDENGRQRDHYIALNVQVPNSIEDGLDLGLDVRSWAEQSLVDELVVGRGYAKFHPTTEFVELARATGVRVYANNTPRDDSLETCRAWAMTHWECGVDGLGIFGQYKDGRFPFLYEIGSRERLRHLDKTYQVNRRLKDPKIYVQNFDLLMGSFPGGQVPVELELAKPVTVFIDCFDDIAEAVRQERLREVRFQLVMQSRPVGSYDLFEFLAGSLAPEDRFSVRVNGKPVPQHAIRPLRGLTVPGFQVPFPRNNYLGLEWVQSPEEVRYGRNEVVVELVHRTRGVVNPLQLELARLNICYQD